MDEQMNKFVFITSCMNGRVNKSFFIYSCMEEYMYKL